MGSIPGAVSMTTAPAGPRCTTSGAATMAALSLPGKVTGSPLAMAAVAASSSAAHDGGGEPALAIGTSRPRSCWKTTQRSASVVSTAPWATASSTRAMMPEDARVWPTASSRSRSRAHRRLASARTILARSSSRRNGLVR